MNANRTQPISKEKRTGDQEEEPPPNAFLKGTVSMTENATLLLEYSTAGDTPAFCPKGTQCSKQAREHCVPLSKQYVESHFRIYFCLS